jgi:very-short-patch-repair endonuclease
MSVERARALRKNETESERRVWRGLRLLRRHGFHFRRQAPIGKYYADFECHRSKIVIELDGLHHATSEQRRYDAERTRFLESAGYRVVRFWNVEANPDSIAQQILILLGPPPPPPTPPLVGGGE